MDIQKTITEAMANEEKALWFIRKLIHDEVKRQIKSYNSPVFSGVLPEIYTKVEYDDAIRVIDKVYNALSPKLRDTNWTDDYDSLLAMTREAMEIIDAWRKKLKI
jgi:hypothetical protein